VDSEHAGRKIVALGPELRQPSATAMRTTAALVRPEHGTAMGDLLADTDVAVVNMGRRTGGDIFAAGAVITARRHARHLVAMSGSGARGTDSR
jgi:hypothetical protein